MLQGIPSASFYSHVNYSVTKIIAALNRNADAFYSHVNYSVTKIAVLEEMTDLMFYSHVNYSVTKINQQILKK